MTGSLDPSDQAAARCPPGVRVLKSASEIAERIRALAIDVSRDYVAEAPVLVGVLKGACMFHADLARAMSLEVQLDFLKVSSYGERRSSGAVRLQSDLATDVAGRHVLVCEGVVDSGRSLSFVLDLLRSRRPASLKVATLLDKRPCREVEVPLDYVGWTVGADFLVGFGLDAAERYRNLPFVGVLKE
jgi:hypoxanthine phosphoribosyltransferase